MCSGILRSFISMCSCQNAKVFLRKGMQDYSYMQILAATDPLRYLKAVEMALALVNESAEVLMTVKFKHRSENCEVVWKQDLQGSVGVVETLTIIMQF